jgi:hypothetical protein
MHTTSENQNVGNKHLILFCSLFFLW